MNGQRILLVLLVVNLFATLLVYRGMELLVERVDGLRCEEVAGAGLPAARPVASAPDRPAAIPAITDRASTVRDDRNDEPEEPVDDVAADMDDIDAIKIRFAAQYGDSARTAQIQQALQAVANSSPAYMEVTQDLIECKETVCKLVLGYADQAVFDAFVDDLTMALKGDLSATLYFDETLTVGGNSTVDVYLVRE